MKVLFLDFDGVLNSRQEVHYHKRVQVGFVWWIKGLLKHVVAGVRDLVPSDSRWRWRLTWFGLKHLSGHCIFCPIACSNIQYLLDIIPDLRIVVSSTWRNRGLDECKDILRCNGIDPTRVIGLTPGHHEDIVGNHIQGIDVVMGRGHQIQAWLNFHHGIVESLKDSLRPIQPVESFVIIDDDSDMFHLSNRLVKTRNNEGFMFRHVKKTMKLFGACDYCESFDGHAAYCKLAPTETCLP